MYNMLKDNNKEMWILSDMTTSKLLIQKTTTGINMCTQFLFFAKLSLSI